MLTSYLAVVATFGKPHAQNYSTEEKLQVVHDFICKDEVEGYQYALYCVEGIMLTLGLYLSYTTRDAPDIINESSYIALGKLRFEAVAVLLLLL